MDSVGNGRLVTIRKSADFKELQLQPVEINGVSVNCPGWYTIDGDRNELRDAFCDLAKRRWSTIRNAEEARLRIDEWLRREKYLDGEAIRKLPAFTVLRWLEDEVGKPSEDQAPSDGKIRKAPNQNSSETRKAKIRAAKHQQQTCRGISKTRASQNLSRWRKRWSIEFAEVEAEFAE